MSRITTHELAYQCESAVVRRLRQSKVPRAKFLAGEIVPEIMALIPTEAFDPKPSWERGILFFHGDVTEEYVREMQEELAAIHGNVARSVPITLYLSSLGGSCDAGLALFSTIQEVRRGGRRVNCHVQGVAMSMGSIIAQACDERTIEPYACMMLHEVCDTISGKTSEIDDALAFQKRLEKILCQLYATRSGKPAEYWLERLARRDWYLTARESVSEGLMDRIRPTPAFRTKRPRVKVKDDAKPA